MAVYTEVSDEALDLFLTDYDLGKVQSLKGIAGGVENTNYMLHAGGGQYILTLYEKRVAEADLPFFVGLMDHLSKKGFPCPSPIRKRNGDALGVVEGRPAALVTFLEGMEVKHPTAEHCRMAGEAMATLHIDAADFTIRRENALNPDGWKPLAKACLPRADEIEPGMALLISQELSDLTAIWPDDLPAGVVHADMFKDNVFFLDGSLSGIIDFYFGCNDFLAYDLAIAINAWCFDDDTEFMPELSKALIGGYQSVRKLEPTEVDCLPVLARGAALRFLLTRVNDWLNVPPGALVIPHDPRVFAKRLRFHQRVRTANSYGIA